MSAPRPCSHAGCARVGVHAPQPGGLHGWLCDEHWQAWHDAIAAALATPERRNIARLLGTWIRAGGGAKAMARKMLGHGAPSRKRRER